jgi:hypothetical protein
VIRILALAMALSPLLASAQAPRPERLESCRDALLFTAEHYDLAAGASGRGGAIDWIGCAANAAVYTAGAAAYSVAGSRWAFARGGAALEWRENVWLALDGSTGSGRTPSQSFDYLTLRDSVTVRLRERWFAKLEHQYIDIATDRGHLVKLAASALATPAILLEAAITRSVGGNLGTRSYSARADWVAARGRLYAGGAHGRTTPQAVDIITGNRLSDAITRQWFAGAALSIGRGEAQFAFDDQRTAGSRRRTFVIALKWPLP